MTFNVFVSVQLAAARNLGVIQWQQVETGKLSGMFASFYTIRHPLPNTVGAQPVCGNVSTPAGVLSVHLCGVTIAASDDVKLNSGHRQDALL